MLEEFEPKQKEQERPKRKKKEEEEFKPAPRVMPKSLLIQIDDAENVEDEEEG